MEVLFSQIKLIWFTHKGAFEFYVDNFFVIFDPSPSVDSLFTKVYVLA